MPRLQRKHFDHPDQVRTFANGVTNVVTLDEVAIGRFIFQPGWRWSKDVAPIAGTRVCGLRHLGYTIGGSLHVRLEDGTELTIGPGDAYEIPPGHDAWVVGDVAWDSVEFTSAHAYGVSPEDLGERVLATILFTDIVGSTELVQRHGDQRWSELLREHNRRVRAAIDRYRGREVDAAGDGFFAVFDGAARAVSAGALMDPAVIELGLRVRVGVHTSEVQLMGGHARGVGVHTAARVAALAGAGEVFVSGTTRDLLDGSGVSLEHRGDYELKGLNGVRPIFALKR
jgi:class 3 adenylate cyclase